MYVKNPIAQLILYFCLKVIGLFQINFQVTSKRYMGGMEASLVSGILNIVGKNLAPLVIKEFSSMAGVSNDLQELQDLVEEINNWLQTVGDKAMRNDRSSNWLKKLKDAAYDAEDLVHEFRIEAEKHEENIVSVKNVIVKHFWTKPKSVVFEFKTAHKIKAIKKRFDAIVKGRSYYSTIANSIPVDRPAQHVSKTIGDVMKIDAQRRHEFYVENPCGKKPRAPTGNNHYRGDDYKRRGITMGMSPLSRTAYKSIYRG
ncbi:Os01g0536950 [Oryza sativa Japonica Group]|uniref:Os01g0536950 protein n=1 Tax=Oryza sativa subsp. japonica TaxID=39947 RepID=A0A0P0V3N2_ORYSJ|nr:hypothetical protein EE612_003249 [Oryza sativa]BAS72550.1 Os01g0536950 [Oryza sativa Japonica Group]